MKLNIISYIILALTVAFPAAGATLTQEADSAYMRDDFAEATRLYLQIAETEGTSSDLYYNLGNCYYRQKQPGKAILYYERALRLDPSNEDARANLEFVNTKITDEPVTAACLSPIPSTDLLARCPLILGREWL